MSTTGSYFSDIFENPHYSALHCVVLTYEPTPKSYIFPLIRLDAFLFPLYENIAPRKIVEKIVIRLFIFDFIFVKKKKIYINEK